MTTTLDSVGRTLALAVFILSCAACGRPTQAPAPTGTQGTVPTGQEKGARTDKPSPVADAPISIAVIVDGKTVTPWTRADLDKTPTIKMTGDSMDHQSWPLREVVAALVDNKVRTVELRGDEAQQVQIDAASWGDASRKPVLRLNRRGLIKFSWVDAKGLPTSDPELRGVREIRIGH